MKREKPVLFKPFLIDAIVRGNSFDLNDGLGERTFFKTQTRRDHKLGDVGDKLWVKESYYENDNDNDGFLYQRDSENGWCFSKKYGHKIRPRWKSPLFMKKKYARVWLEITGIRQERLGDISETDCIKEGIFKLFDIFWDNGIDCASAHYETAQDAFFDLIKFIKKGQEPDLDTIVWVHDFKVVEKNEPKNQQHGGSLNEKGKKQWVQKLTLELACPLKYFFQK